MKIYFDEYGIALGAEYGIEVYFGDYHTSEELDIPPTYMVTGKYRGDIQAYIEDYEAEGVYYMISPSGFDIAAVLEVFWKKLRYTSPTELELSLRDILSEVEMTEERKKSVVDILQRMVSLGLIDKYRR